MKTDHVYWSTIWGKALANMPCRKHGSTAGRYGALARCLGLPLYSPSSYTGHSRVYNAHTRGNMPRDVTVRYKLLVCASPLGHVLAKRKFEQLGIAHRYD